MKKTPRQLFEELDDNEFFKSTEKASRHFRELKLLPAETLGFHDDSNGFLVLHCKHSPTGLSQEIPACLILKNLGFSVILLDESSTLRTPDVMISGTIFEIKRISNAQRLHMAIGRQFRSGFQQSENVLLHIDQSVSPEQLRNGLFFAVKLYPQIKLVWVIFTGRLWQFERLQILKGKFDFK